MTVTSDEIMAVVEGQTIPSEFLKTVEANRDAVALRWMNDDGSWGEWTYGDYAERAAPKAAGITRREVGATTGAAISALPAPTGGMKSEDIEAAEPQTPGISGPDIEADIEAEDKTRQRR